MKQDQDLAYRIEKTLKAILQLRLPVVELYYGIKSRTIPWHLCGAWALASAIVLFFNLDHFIIIHTRFRDLYPYLSMPYKVYAFGIVTSAFWCWALAQIYVKNQKLAKLTAAFRNAGLESKIGRLPSLISDYSLDRAIRKLKVTNAGFPLAKFQEQSRYIESELGIFIDHVKENRETRSVEIIYSHFAMPDQIPYSLDVSNNISDFFVGQTRAHPLLANFEDTPHLMIAGQTGGGKSTFLRQLIVHIRLKSPSTNFLLIDLKGGLEFSLFEDRKQFHVVPNVNAAIEALKKMSTLLEFRMTLLKGSKCKDFEAYNKSTSQNKTIPLTRQLIVVDEAAEMFLAGHHANSKDIQEARNILSKIARQGRAIGIHLVIATQRPDAKSLDPQVKANLTGVVCFQMMNDASSIAVLGNGRATDLPRVPGRAIWKNGMEMVEVQTPFLDSERALELLGPPDNVKVSTPIPIPPADGTLVSKSDQAEFHAELRVKKE